MGAFPPSCAHAFSCVLPLPTKNFIMSALTKVALAVFLCSAGVDFFDFVIAVEKKSGQSLTTKQTPMPPT